MQTQLQKQRKDPAETRCKIALLILFLLGAALIAGGLWGSREYQNSGFDQENAYHYIHELSGKVDSLSFGIVLNPVAKDEIFARVEA